MKIAPCALFAAFVIVLASSPARSATDQDALWKKLVDVAVARGGVETVTPDGGSATTAFQAEDGGILTLNTYPSGGDRSVCALDKAQAAIVCGDLAARKVSYGLRDAFNAPWTFRERPVKPKAAVWARLRSGLFHFIALGGPVDARQWRCGAPCIGHAGLQRDRGSRPPVDQAANDAQNRQRVKRPFFWAVISSPSRKPDRRRRRRMCARAFARLEFRH